jgi:D-alanyl-D-alanine carboxypeptidase
VVTKLVDAVERPDHQRRNRWCSGLAPGTTWGVDVIDSSNHDAESVSDAAGWLPALRVKLDEESAAGRFAGAVLVAQGGQRIFAQAYGLADREQMIPNRLSTRFRNGSISKVFTAVAVTQLVQAGHVDLTAPLGTYLSDYPNRDLAANVTIHHLLTHTGGTGDIFVPEYMERREQVRTIADYVTLLGQRGPEFEPGAQADYSNYGYILLGAVIEQVSGKSYYDYVDEHVFKPAGMASTGSLPEETMVPDRAVGYTDDSEHGGRNTGTLPYCGTPASHGYTTVEDLWRFATALTGHRLLDARHTHLMTTGKVDPGWRGPFIGYGCVEEIVYGIRVFGAAGAAPGMSGDLTIYPDSGYIIAVLANIDPPIAQQVSTFICHRLPVTRQDPPS